MSKKERVTKQILGVLRGAEAGRIRFIFPSGIGNITISAKTFRDVARAIETGDIDVDPDAVLGGNIAARYSSTSDTVQIAKAVIGREQFGDLLHECTHAWFDMNGNALSVSEDEAAAYVVDALYYRMSGLSRPRRSANEPFDFADAVAVDLLKQYQAGKAGIPRVDSVSWNLLRATIAIHPVYRKFIAAGGYTHNGLYRPAVRMVKKAAGVLKSMGF